MLALERDVKHQTMSIVTCFLYVTILYNPTKNVLSVVDSTHILLLVVGQGRYQDLN